jgi:predicted DNA-binding transcriptional regulator YafY
MPARSATTAEAQLERILYILPAAAREEGVRLDELARTLDVTPATVLQDLETVAARAYYHPAGAVESFTIMIEGDAVHVDAPAEFRRPVRLAREEALALGLGLRALAADAEPTRRTEILALATRLEAELTAPDVQERAVGRTAVAEPEVAYEEHVLAFADDGFRGVVADAIQQRRCCRLLYLKPGDLAPMHRRIAPYRLVYADGMWYVAAYDLEREALRFFRMDRVLDGSIEAEAAPTAPAELATMLGGGAPYNASDDMAVTVRYSPRIARWIEERSPRAQQNEDGSVVVQHRVADPRWIVRHVLQYGGEAVVEEPEQARLWVRTAALDVLTD